MSFEAVPCMFKSRQEDGNEAQLFGLLIRPSSSATSATTMAMTAQTQQLSAPTSVVPFSASAHCPSAAIQLVPCSTTENGKKLEGQQSGFGIQQKGGGGGGGMTLFTSNGMPPILPRPKADRTRTRMRAPPTSKMTKPLVPPVTTTNAQQSTFEMAQSPSQVVPQMGAAGIVENCEALSVTTSRSASSTPSSSTSATSAFLPSASSSDSSSHPNGLLGINASSPPSQSSKAKSKPKNDPKATTQRRRRNNKQTEGAERAMNGGGGELLLADLHSIDYNQLINSTVITTEDYLPSQSDPIYTNMDMYNPSLMNTQQETEGAISAKTAQSEGANGNKTQQRHNLQQHFEQNAVIAPSSSSLSASASTLCPSAIFLHNHHQQQQHHQLINNLPPSTSSSSSSSASARYGAISSQQPQQHQQSHWNPYMGAHPGGSHISSTPDSGIQSIDGSPPSVYTPPMVSPYASQVRSCESVNNGGGHGMIISNIPSAQHHPPSSSSFYASYASSSCGHESLLITAVPSAPAPPPLISEQISESVEGNHNYNDPQEADFSDMPKLIPMTNSCEQHQEEERHGGRGSAAPTEEKGEERKPPGEVMFHQGMSLHELAECLTSNISREQLRLLTSLIQRKAEEEHQKSQEVTTERNANNELKKNGETAEGKQEKREEEAEQQQRTEQRMVTSADDEAQADGGEPNRGKQIGRNVNDAEDGHHPDEKDEAEEREKKRMAELATYRARVREQLNRKLAKLIERVMCRMKQCHLNIRAEGEGGRIRGWPWKMPNWEEVCRRVKAQEGAERRWMTEEEVKNRKKRGRKKKGDDVEEQAAGRKKKKNSSSKEDVKRYDGRKRGRKDDEEEEGRRGGRVKDEKSVNNEKKGGRKRKMSEEDDDEENGREEEVKNERKKKKPKMNEKDGRKEEARQATPPLIIRIRAPSSSVGTSALSTIKRATAKQPRNGRSSGRSVDRHNTPKKRRPSRSPNPIIGPSSSSSSLIPVDARKLTIAIASATNASIKRQKWRNSNPVKQLDGRERQIVRANKCFLLRNLGQTKQRRTDPSSGLYAILGQILAHFCAIIEQNYHPMVSHRQLDDLRRTVNILLIGASDSPPASSSSSTLLSHFDALLKQFIGTTPATIRESLCAQFAFVKHSVDFANCRIHPALQKSALIAFLEESCSSPCVSQSASSKRDCLQRPLTVDTSIDLSYLDSAHPVGQWDPDAAAKLSPSSDNRERDCVRCICGITEDDGLMNQCDRCHFWLHADCLDSPVMDDEQAEFVCDFCARCVDTTPRVDIVLKPQPNIKLSGCTYFRTLVNSRGLQVRLNESVYVERLINDKHKSILRELHEECVRKQQIGATTPTQQSPAKRRDGSNGSRGGGGGGSSRRGRTGSASSTRKVAQESEEVREERVPNRWWDEHESAASFSSSELSRNFHRRDLRSFRVERLFTSPNGQRFIFGCYYARPHETFCDSSRMFHRNELFWTPLFDTLPLDSVVGRCLVLEPQIWAIGRPKSPRYLEDDVFVCEYQIDRNQRSFERIPPKNRYYINTEPYIFNMFHQKLTMKRDFTPFQLANNSINELQSSLSSSSSLMTMPPPPSCSNSSSCSSSALLIRQRIRAEHIDNTVFAKIAKWTKEGKCSEER